MIAYAVAAASTGGVLTAAVLWGRTRRRRRPAPWATADADYVTRRLTAQRDRERDTRP